jgi:hypothetical protein
MRHTLPMTQAESGGRHPLRRLVGLALAVLLLAACNGDPETPDAPVLWQGFGVAVAIDDMEDPSRVVLQNGDEPLSALAHREGEMVVITTGDGDTLAVLTPTDEDAARLAIEGGPSFMMRGQPCSLVMPICAALYR